MGGLGAAAFLLALYLAILFQAWAGPRGKQTEDSPFRSGFAFRNPDRHAWKTGLLILGTMGVFVGGAACAVAKTAAPVVAGSAVFLFLIASMTPLFFGLRLLAGPWMERHPHAVLNLAFLAPPALGLLTGVLVAVA